MLWYILLPYLIVSALVFLVNAVLYIKCWSYRYFYTENCKRHLYKSNIRFKESIESLFNRSGAEYPAEMFYSLSHTEYYDDFQEAFIFSESHFERCMRKCLFWPFRKPDLRFPKHMKKNAQKAVTALWYPIRFVFPYLIEFFLSTEGTRDSVLTFANSSLDFLSELIRNHPL